MNFTAPLFVAAAAMLTTRVAATAIGIDNTTALVTSNGTTNATSSSPFHPFFLGSFQLCGVDIVGGDVRNERGANGKDCLAKCNASPNCNAVTWTNYNGGTCWFKNTYNGIPPTTPDAGADGYFLLPNEKRSLIWSDVYSNVDMVGGDIGPIRYANIAMCRDECSRNSLCFAVVWTDYQGGTCWFKKRASAFVPKAGAQASFVARADTDPAWACP